MGYWAASGNGDIKRLKYHILKYDLLQVIWCTYAISILPDRNNMTRISSYRVLYYLLKIMGEFIVHYVSMYLRAYWHSKYDKTLY